MMQATICEIIKEKKILLQKKSSGRFGEGKWNGAGGKIEQGETPIEGVIREVYEETGLTILNPILRGCIDFYFGEKQEPDWVTYIFYVSEFKGSLKASEEGELRWFSLDEIPYDEMWQDDEYWLPVLIEGKSFRGTFWFNEEGTELIKHSLEIE